MPAGGVLILQTSRGERRVSTPEFIDSTLEAAEIGPGGGV